MRSITVRNCWRLLGIVFVATITCFASASAPATTSATGYGGKQVAPQFWRWAETPPMGWNSYDSYADAVTQQQVISNASYMKKHLLEYGYQYVVIDYRWYDPKAAPSSIKASASTPLEIDRYGRLQPAPNRFPSSADGKGFKAIARKIHAMGLKFGIHIMRGIPKEAVEKNDPISGSPYTARDAADTSSISSWNSDMYGVKGDTPAGQAWYESIVKQYAAWGVDLIKCDDMSRPYHSEEIEALRNAIDRTGRHIVLSLSPGPTPIAEASNAIRHANMWRISNDLWDSWPEVLHHFKLLHQWEHYIGAGHWPDADMIPVGDLAPHPVGPARWTHLTRPEQRTLISLWAMARSPLFLGMNLKNDDAWTLALLTNPAVIDIDQHSTGNHQLMRRDGLIVWGARAANSRDRYLAFFNIKSRVRQTQAAYRSTALTGGMKQRKDSISIQTKGARYIYLVSQVLPRTKSWIGQVLVNNYDVDWARPQFSNATGQKFVIPLNWSSANPAWPNVRTGQSIEGGPMRVASSTYVAGFGTHAGSIIKVRVPKGATWFNVIAGVDNRTPRIGKDYELRLLVFRKNPAGASGGAIRKQVKLDRFGLDPPLQLEDLWSHRSLTSKNGILNIYVPLHGVVLYKIREMTSTK